MNYYLLSFLGNGAIAQSFDIENELKRIGLNVVHDYGNPDGSLFKFVCTSASKSQLVDFIVSQLGVPLLEVTELTSNYKTTKLSADGKELTVAELFHE